MSAVLSSTAEKAGEVLNKVADAAEEFVDELNPTKEDGQEGSAEAEGGDVDAIAARKKKLEELRKKMVRSEPRSLRCCLCCALTTESGVSRGRQRKPTALL